MVEMEKFQKDELSYKFLLAKQLDRIGRISSQMGFHGLSKETDLYSAVFLLQTMLSPYFEEDMTQRGSKTPQVIKEIQEIEVLAEQEGSDIKDYPITLGRLNALMGFMKRQNLLLEVRGRGR